MNKLLDNVREVKVVELSQDERNYLCEGLRVISQERINRYVRMPGLCKISDLADVLKTLTDIGKKLGDESI